MSAEENDIRKDLEAAFEQHSEEPEHKEAGGPAADAKEPVGSAAPAEGQEPIATEGAEPPVAEDGSKPEGAPAAPAKPAAAPGAEQQAQAPTKEELGAPIGWKAGAREHWKTIPRAAQEEIVRREKETAQTLRQSSQARQLAQDFQQTINPFLPLIQAQNSNPLAAVKNLMTTAAGLSVGTPLQKAQIVREIIQNYGIDIQTLDQVLSGQPINPQTQQNPSGMAPPPWATPLFQFMSTVQQSRQQREQQIVADAEAETEAFASKHEFFDDVREEMADLMEMAAKRGVVMSMDDAYKKAVSLNPDISSVVNQRVAAKRSQGNAIQRNRNAASSISGAPRNGPTGAKSGEDSRRSALEQAWEDQTGR
jgi:hypothetical protein